MTQPVNPAQFANMYPGQTVAPQAPVPQAGGFDQSLAPQAQAFNPHAQAAAIAAPQGQPIYNAQGQIVGFAPAVAAAPSPAPAVPVAPQGQPIYNAQGQIVGFAPTVGAGAAAPYVPQPAPQHQAYAQPAPVIDAAYEARMRQVAMGNGRRQVPPIGDYVAVIASSEIALVGPEKGRKLRVFFAAVTIESSSNATIQPGHKAKFSEFLESDFDMDQAMGKFKGMCAGLYGAQTEDQLWASRPNWLTEVQQSPGPFVGVRVSMSVRQAVNREKKPKFNDDGSPALKCTVQRIG